MDYAAKRETLIQQHNDLLGQAGAADQQVKNLREAATEIRGQIVLLEQLIIEEEEINEEGENGSDVDEDT